MKAGGGMGVWNLPRFSHVITDNDGHPILGGRPSQDTSQPVNSSGQLRWQRGAWGRYAGIEISVDENQSGLQVAIAEAIGAEWHVPIRAGFLLFSDEFAWEQILPVTVTVHSLQSMPGDTTAWCVTYVAFQALCSAWKVDGSSVFAFDASTGRFLLHGKPMDETV